MKSIYQLITGSKKITFEYLEDIKLHILFQPIIEIRDIEDTDESVLISRAFEYSVEDKIAMIKFVVCCFSKESPYQKKAISLNTVMVDVAKDLKIRQQLKDKIFLYKIPELNKVIDEYLKREDDENYRNLKVTEILRDEYMSACTTPILNVNGEVDYKMKTYVLEQGLLLNAKLFELEQKATAKENDFVKIKKGFNELSLNNEDLAT